MAVRCGSTTEICDKHIFLPLLRLFKICDEHIFLYSSYRLELRRFGRERRSCRVESYEELVGRRFSDIADEGQRRQRIAAKARSLREDLRAQTAESLGGQLWAFGILNYPLPQ